MGKDRRYFLWKAPADGLPEFTSGGHGVVVLPGFGNWVILMASSRKIPPDAIPVSDVVNYLEGRAMSDWQPISTAPKDGTRILLYRSGHIVCGRWNDDRYAIKPRPYWSHDQERVLSKTDARKDQPTHWRPLIPPTEGGQNDR